MSQTVQTGYAVDGDVAVITMQNPPVNGLGLDLRRSIIESLRRAENDAAVKAIVLLMGATGDANMWVAVFADVGVLVLAILNAMRALIVPKK